MSEALVTVQISFIHDRLCAIVKPVQLMCRMKRSAGWMANDTRTNETHSIRTEKVCYGSFFSRSSLLLARLPNLVFMIHGLCTVGFVACSLAYLLAVVKRLNWHIDLYKHHNRLTMKKKNGELFFAELPLSIAIGQCVCGSIHEKGQNDSFRDMKFQWYSLNIIGKTADLISIQLCAKFVNVFSFRMLLSLLPTKSEPFEEEGKKRVDLNILVYRKVRSSQSNVRLMKYKSLILNVKGDESAKWSHSMISNSDLDLFWLI